MTSVERQLTPRAKQAIALATTDSASRGFSSPNSADLLTRLVAAPDDVPALLLENSGIDVSAFRSHLESRMSPAAGQFSSGELARIMDGSRILAELTHDDCVGTFHIFAAILFLPECAAVQLMKQKQQDFQLLKDEVRRFIGGRFSSVEGEGNGDPRRDEIEMIGSEYQRIKNSEQPIDSQRDQIKELMCNMMTAKIAEFGRLTEG